MVINESINIRILYGGNKEFRDFFVNEILTPSGLKPTAKTDIKQINFAPPLRITIIDDKDLIMSLIKTKGKKGLKDKRDITEVSALHSDNDGLIEYASRTFMLLRTTADADLGKGFKE